MSLLYHSGPQKALDKAHAALNFLGSANLVFFILPLLMLNLVAGTLAQHYLGLYEAHKIFFASFFYFVEPLPVPGTYTLLGLLSLSLLAKCILRSEWTWRKSGTILAHFGTLILLIGGLLTALTAREGFMVIAEGDSTPYIYDYNNREFFIFRDEALQHRVAFSDLRGEITLPNFPFVLKAVGRCANCAIQKREETGGYKDMARFMKLEAKILEKENETNIPGFTFELSGGSADQNGTYIAFENMPKPVMLKRGSHTYKLILGKEQRLLPFSVSLDDFRKEDHPGTTLARAYESDVVVHDGSIEQKFRIGMNEPLRYKGYTFYQSSFEQVPTRETTILNVVENKGRLFPYIATALVAAGLLLQLALSARESRT
ncbi:MAG: cytochrome c biogenesis protein ResB [Alphaproteobacteria bacterium]